MLDGLVEPGHLRQVLFAEGMLRPQHAWPTDPPPYGLASKGRLLMHFGLTHNFGHWHDITAVLGFLGHLT